MKVIEKCILVVGLGLNFVAGLFLMAMMFVGAGDVIGRYFFDRPIIGAYEISSLLMGGMVFLSWAYTMSQKAHVTVDILFMTYPPRLQAVLSFIMMFFSVILFSIIGWQSWLRTVSDWQGGKLIKNVLLPLAPVKSLICIGALLICLEIILQMIHLVPQIITGRKN